jgi:hypothetical protein
MRNVSIRGVDLNVDFVAADGQRVQHDFAPWLPPSMDLDKDMDEAASKIAWAGALLGLLHEADEVLDAEYRTWRADKGEQMLSMSEKLSEHKIKQLVESDPEFVAWKRRLGKVRRDVRTVEVVVNALSAQADMLRSRGANRRAELHHIGMSTLEKDPEASFREVETSKIEPQHDDEDRERRVAAALAETERDRS